MKITYNGTHHDVSDGLSLEKLLSESGINIQSPGIAVACNERIISRPQWQKHCVADGDRIEVVHAVQGG